MCRAHLEEDAGKNIHSSGQSYSQVDLNRAGVPLLEIVTEPDFRTGAEAAAYGEELRRIVRFLGISDGNMQVRMHTQPPILVLECLPRTGARQDVREGAAESLEAAGCRFGVRWPRSTFPAVTYHVQTGPARFIRL